MAAAAPNRAPRDVVDFPPNIPVSVALKFATPRTVSGINGERFMFSLTDGRVMFLDPEVAGQIASLGVNVRENFSVTKRWNGQRETPATWEVARVCGEQPNGTFVAPAVATAAENSGARGTAQPGDVAQQSGAAVSPKSPASAVTASGAPSALEEQVNMCVDAYAACLGRALEKHGGKVKPEEVKSIFLTLVINRGSRVA